MAADLERGAVADECDHLGKRCRMGVYRERGELARIVISP
jgi:hypothetical protein